jgi:hypothetical protein
MTDIEADWGIAKRKSSGAEVSMSVASPELSTEACVYINPVLGHKVGFAGKWIYEPRQMEKDGKVIRRLFCLGVILLEGELRGSIMDAARRRLSRAEIDGLVSDCYELLIALMHAFNERQDEFGIQPQIYKAPRSWHVTNSWDTTVGPDAIATSGVVRIVQVSSGLSSSNTDSGSGRSPIWRSILSGAGRLLKPRL